MARGEDPMITWLILAGIAALVILAGLLTAAVLIRAAARRKSKQAEPQAPAQTAEARKASEDLRALHQELEGLSGRLDERLERRLNELKRLLAGADRRITELR